MMPTAQRLEVLVGVVVAGDDMVHLVGGLAAQDAEGVPSLAAVGVATKDPHPAGGPVSWQPLPAVACLPAH